MTYDPQDPIWFGMGWCEPTSDAGYVAVAEGGAYAMPLPPTVQRAMILDDAATRREQAERAAQLEDIQDNRRGWAQHLQRSGVDTSFTGFLQRMDRGARLTDVRTAAAERRALAQGIPPTEAEERDYDRRVARMRAFRQEEEALRESPLTLQERRVRERLDRDRELNRAAWARR
jgi:hypothetical protein